MGGAFGGELVDSGAERGEAGLEIAVFGDDELLRGGGAFGPGEDVDDELLEGPEAEGGFLVGDLEFAHGGEDGDGAVAEHLGDGHFAPLGAVVGRQGIGAGEEGGAVLGVPNGLGHRGDCSGIC